MHYEAKDRDPVWDCTLIKVMRDKGDTVVNPIYEWTDDDVWAYVNQNEIPMNPLYEMGYKRVGCVGCPMASYRERLKEFEDFPKYKGAYIRAMQRMIDRRIAEGKEIKNDCWSTGEKMFDWWIEKWKHEMRGQEVFDFADNDISDDVPNIQNQEKGTAD